jgi:RNA polymerase sigma factor (TIGR02999 family)
MSDITQILSQVEQRDPLAAEQLLEVVYDELRKLAASKLAQENSGQTLQPTALVHEAWLRLVGAESGTVWNSRGHFFGAAAEAMRRILVERARRKARIRHGGEWQRLNLDDIHVAAEDSDEAVLAMNEALEALARESPQKAEIVKLHYFTGMQYPEIAQALGISLATVKRHCAFARSWLHLEMKKNLPDS